MSDNKRVTRSQSKNDAKRLRVEPEGPLGIDVINTLNDDCLAEVFRYLSIQDRLRVQAVCKRWRKNHQLVWGRLRTLDFNSRRIPRHLKNDKAIAIILKRSGIFMRQIKNGNLLNNIILSLIVKHCPNLQRLEMRTRDENCTKWLSRMERLECLEMAGHFSNKPVDTLSCVNLTTLELSSASEPMGSLHSSMFESLPKLSSLIVSDFYLTKDVLMAIFQSPNITSLAISWCNITGQLPLMSVNTAALELLKISAMDETIDNFLSWVSEICTNLRYLKLDLNSELTDNGIAKLQKLPKLEELDVFGSQLMTDEPLSRMHALKRLTCRSCHRVGDHGIITLMKYAHNLQFLNLEFSEVTERVLIEASKIVKKRSNDLELKILVRNNVKSQWKPEDISPLLVVETERD